MMVKLLEKDKTNGMKFLKVAEERANRKGIFMNFMNTNKNLIMGTSVCLVNLFFLPTLIESLISS